MKFAVLLVSILAFFSAHNALARAEIIARTGSPAIYEKRSLLTALMTEADYRSMTAQLAKLAFFPSIRRKPESLSVDARFGFNLSFGGLNRSWIVDGNETKGYVFYADWNGNGDLADDGAPLKFQIGSGGGKTFLHYRTRADEGAESYPVEIKLELTGETAPGQSAADRSLAFYERTIRRGKISLGGSSGGGGGGGGRQREIDFGLVGSRGLYDTAAGVLLFDLDGDGRFDDETERSAERYAPIERYVNLAGASYEFKVDRYGDKLTLKRLDETLPDRGLLEPGNPAPDFSFVDTNSGQTRRLSDFRGKIVLLEFWASWCVACRTDAPKISALYPRLPDKGFEIIGVNVNDEESAFGNFITAFNMTWTHARENADGRLQKIYRANVYPAYYLIDADGRILASRIKSRDLFAEIERRLKK